MPFDRKTLETHDLDVAAAVLSDVFGDVELSRDGVGRTSLSIRTVDAPGLSAVRWKLDGVAAGSLDRDQADVPAVLTGMLVGGRMEMQGSRQEIDTTRPFLYPEHIDSQLSGADVANVAMPITTLDAVAVAMTGAEVQEVRFTGTAPLTPLHDRVWRDTMVYASRTLDALAELPDPSLPTSALLDHVAQLMLHTFPNTALAVEADQRSGGSGPPSLRRAQQFIDDNLDRPFSAAELAGAARLSLRGLHAMFRRELGTTPMAHVRRARLAAVRVQLQRADPATAEIARIAAEWGFTNARRFRAVYREAFDETPTATVEGRRSG